AQQDYAAAVKGLQDTRNSATNTAALTLAGVVAVEAADLIADQAVMYATMMAALNDPAAAAAAQAQYEQDQKDDALAVGGAEVDYLKAAAQAAKAYTQGE